MIAYLRYQEGKRDPHEVMRDAFEFWSKFARKYGKFFTPVMLSTVKQKDGTYAVKIQVDGYYPVKELYQMWKHGTIRIQKDIVPF